MGGHIAEEAGPPKASQLRHVAVTRHKQDLPKRTQSRRGFICRCQVVNRCKVVEARQVLMVRRRMVAVQRYFVAWNG